MGLGLSFGISNWSRLEGRLFEWRYIVDNKVPTNDSLEILHGLRIWINSRMWIKPETKLIRLQRITSSVNIEIIVITTQIVFDWTDRGSKERSLGNIRIIDFMQCVSSI